MELLLRNSFFHLPHSIPQSRNNHSRCTPWTKPLPPLLFLNRNSHYSNLSSKVLFGVRFDGPIMEIGEDSGMEDGDIVVETCITRTLPPALTLEKGLESIKEAVEKLKLNPPGTSSGFFRFQVAVPPSAKALDWFCCQPESSGVFPLLFMSKETKNLDCKSLYVNETRGVFGIGSAVHFTRSSSSISREKTTTKR